MISLDKKIQDLLLKSGCFLGAFLVTQNLYCQERRAKSIKKSASLFQRIGEVITKSSVEVKNDIRIHNEVFSYVAKENMGSSFSVARRAFTKKMRPHLKKEFKEARELADQISVGLSLRNLLGKNSDSKNRSRDSEIVYDVVVQDIRSIQTGDLQASLSTQPNLGSSSKNAVIWSIEPVSKPRLNNVIHKKKARKSFDIKFKAGLRDGKPKLSVYDSNKYYRAEVSSSEGLIQEVHLPLFHRTSLRVEHKSEATTFVLDGILKSHNSNISMQYETEDKSLSTSYEYSQSNGIVGVDLTIPENASSSDLQMQVSLGFEI